jgi:hypothetical protein
MGEEEHGVGCCGAVGVGGDVMIAQPMMIMRA